ncbi:MAG: nucleotide exchange factor GrpE [Candidatus Hydrothermia bacterium]
MSEFFRGLTEERNRYRDACARAMADLENLRAEARRQAEEAERRGAERVVFALLPALDSMERAIEYARDNPDPDALLSGINMIRDEINHSLESIGARRIEIAKGQEFNPGLMEAVETRGEGNTCLVADMLAPGYEFRGRILRPARVMVELRHGEAKETEDKER